MKLAQRGDRLSGAPEGSRERETPESSSTPSKQDGAAAEAAPGCDCRPLQEEQPVIDSERQLSGKVVDEDTRSALEGSDQITPEQLLLIDAILTLPETSTEKELQRRIAAIHAITVYCGVEEERSHLHVRRGRPAGGGVPTFIKAEEQARSERDVVLSKVILSVMSDRRLTKCFLYLGNQQLAIREKIRDYATPGSLSRHFHNRHVKKILAEQQMDCGVCDIRLLHRMHLLDHAERYHGTVSRRTTRINTT